MGSGPLRGREGQREKEREREREREGGRGIRFSIPKITQDTR